MHITIILCQNYLQIVRFNYVYFGQINESVCLFFIRIKFTRQNKDMRLYSVTYKYYIGFSRYL